MASVKLFLNNKKGRINGKIKNIPQKEYRFDHIDFYSNKPVKKKEKPIRENKKCRSNKSDQKRKRRKNEKTDDQEDTTPKTTDRGNEFPELEVIRQKLVRQLEKSGYIGIQDGQVSMLMMYIEEDEELPDDTYTIKFQGRTWTHSQIGSYISEERKKRQNT